MYGQSPQKTDASLCQSLLHYPRRTIVFEKICEGSLLTTHADLAGKAQEIPKENNYQAQLKRGFNHIYHAHIARTNIPLCAF